MLWGYVIRMGGGASWALFFHFWHFMPAKNAKPCPPHVRNRWINKNSKTNKCKCLCKECSAAWKMYWLYISAGISVNICIFFWETCSLNRKEKNLCNIFCTCKLNKLTLPVKTRALFDSSFSNVLQDIWNCNSCPKIFAFVASVLPAASILLLKALIHMASLWFGRHSLKQVTSALSVIATAQGTFAT